jgi:hypothetical protein
MMRLLLAALLLALASLQIAPAAEPATNPEITELLRYVEQADARFIRNGSAYSAKEGADHLRAKLAKAGGKVKTAEDFIEGIASKSYLSGEKYLVKFRDGHTEPTGDWLRAHLTAVRKRGK